MNLELYMYNSNCCSTACPGTLLGISDPPSFSEASTLVSKEGLTLIRLLVVLMFLTCYDILRLLRVWTNSMRGSSFLTMSATNTGSLGPWYAIIWEIGNGTKTLGEGWNDLFMYSIVFPRNSCGSFGTPMSLGMVQHGHLVESQQHLSPMQNDKVWLCTSTKPIELDPSKRSSKFCWCCLEAWRKKCLDLSCETDINSTFPFSNIPFCPTLFYLRFCWGALTMMTNFHPDQVKFCSMHALNLGFTLWLLGGAVVILDEELGVWGGSDMEKSQRLHYAYLDFQQWASTRKLQLLGV